MKIHLTRLLILTVLCYYTASFTHTFAASFENSPIAHMQQTHDQSIVLTTTADAPTTEHLSPTPLPPTWLALPFIILLIMIATGPLLYERFWHKHYPKIAVGLAAFVFSYYVWGMHNIIRPLEASVEYIQFIVLIGALYMAAGGILIEIRQHRYPALVNIILLMVGAILANLIGTTGASMLLIRPFIRFNRHRSKIFHVIFFIWIVSNIGGALTPIGDPPLFLGFLKGVPFLWTLQNNIVPWAIILCFLITAFYIFDSNRPEDDNPPPIDTSKPFLTIKGKRNFLWLGIVIAAVFIDPHLFNWVPAINYHGHSFSFVRELVLFAVMGLSYLLASKTALIDNEFSLEPLKEVTFIFIGIFGTMVPALTLISAYAQSPGISQWITPNTLYWATGVFSSVLDNAPTYLNFLAASMASQGADILNPADVQKYADGGIFACSILRLKAISLASVFFGAMTYIGNGPNFMVKSIAEHLNIQMPSFVRYIVRFTLPFLLPLLAIIWLIYICFAYLVQ